MSFDGRSDAQMSLVKLLLLPGIPTYNLCRYGKSLAKVIFLPKNGNSWKKEFWTTTIFVHLVMFGEVVGSMFLTPKDLVMLLCGIFRCPGDCGRCVCFEIRRLIFCILQNDADF